MILGDKWRLCDQTVHQNTGCTGCSCKILFFFVFPFPSNPSNKRSQCTVTPPMAGQFLNDHRQARTGEGEAAKLKKKMGKTKYLMNTLISTHHIASLLTSSFLLPFILSLFTDGLL